MAKQEFLNFKDISSSIQFSDVLDWLNIAYESKGKELRGEGFIINIEKNLFFFPEDESKKGSIINFVSFTKNLSVRDAALLLKKQFLSKIHTPKRDIPNLTLQYDEYLSVRGISPEIAKQYEVGLVKETRSVVSGRIVFKVYDHDGVSIRGYIGYKVKDNSWFTPRGMKRPLYNRGKITDTRSVIVTANPFDALMIMSLTKYGNVVSLLGQSMTNEQEIELKVFKYVLLLHSDPANIIGRLYNNSFIKAPVLKKPVHELSQKELIEIIKPS